MNEPVVHVISDEHCLITADFSCAHVKRCLMFRCENMDADGLCLIEFNPHLTHLYLQNEKDETFYEWMIKEFNETTDVNNTLSHLSLADCFNMNARLPVLFKSE